ncbi:MAG: hypothetical protein Q9170_002699 [Blastenia crenularia]
MAIATFLALTLLFNGLNAGPVPSPASDRSCVSFMLPVPASAQNAEYDIVHVDDNISASAFIADIDTWSFNQSSRLLRNITTSGTYNISVQLCIPPTGIKKQDLMIATHGGAFDKRYWDAAIKPSEYSFVHAALADGYSILTYDRLGTGLSDKPDAYTVVQAPLQVEILRSITNMARSGEVFKHVASTTLSAASTKTFKRIIHVGHSFGTLLTTALLATYGNLSDAAVLTGYIPNPHFAEGLRSSFDPQYAPQNNMTLFGDRSSGYVTPGTRSSFQTLFFSNKTNATTGIGGFDTEALDYAYSIRQTFATSELLAITMNPGAAVQFKGPLQFMVAEYDFAICRGDCNQPYDRAAFEKQYPNATDIDIYIQQGTGHGLTLHRKANLGFKVTLDWLHKNGL